MRCHTINLPVVKLSDISLSADQILPRRGIILVSPEQVDSELYRHTVGQLWSTRKLRRFVVDEAHVIVLSDHYRECMTKLRLFRAENITAQLLLMTATAPPSLTPKIFSALRCDARNTICLRGNLRRDNVSMSVRRLRSGNQSHLITRVKEEVMSAVAHTAFVGPGKHLIMVLTRDDADDILGELVSDPLITAGQVEVRKYHSGMSIEERNSSGNAWREAPVGTKKAFIMVATDGFGVGIDAPDVRTVIVAGCARSLIDLWQVSGRVGRDGSRGRSVVLFHEHHIRRANVDDIGAKKLLSLFVRWANNASVCRVSAIESYLGSSGSSESCWERKGANGCATSLCDVCEDFLNPSKRVLEEEMDVGTWKEAKRLCVRKRDANMSSKAFTESQLTEKLPLPSSVSQLSFSASPTYNSLLPHHSTSDLRKSVDELRRRAQLLREHCAACVAIHGGTGKKENNGKLKLHSKLCWSGLCLRCLGKGHNAGECPNLIRPSAHNGVKGCTACFLLTLRGQ